MIRRNLDLDLHSLDTFSMLIHGDYNTFKTFLVGSFLAWAIRQGKTALYWNIEGENGMRTLANFPEITPAHIWTLETYADLKAGLEELAKSPVDAFRIDSGKMW